MGNERCLAYTDKNPDVGFNGEDFDCNEVGSIICDTNPTCPMENKGFANWLKKPMQLHKLFFMFNLQNLGNMIYWIHFMMVNT